MLGAVGPSVHPWQCVQFGRVSVFANSAKFSSNISSIPVMPPAKAVMLASAPMEMIAVTKVVRIKRNARHVAVAQVLSKTPKTSTMLECQEVEVIADSKME